MFYPVRKDARFVLTYSFAENSNIIKYEYLYRCIKRDILQGVLQPDVRLPSKRAFAKNQNVSVSTIENAYAQLLLEGFIYSKPRSFFYVSSFIRPVMRKSIIDKKIEPSSSKKERVFADLVSNRTSAHQFPFATWAKLMREVISKQKVWLMTPSEGQGVWPLRQAIASHLRAFRGLEVHPDQIVVGAGTEYLYGLLIQLLGREKKYAVENPGYPKIWKIYQANGVQWIPIDMDQKGLCPEKLETSRAQVVHLSPSHHFPTGRVTPVGRRYELFEWALQSPERFIIEDDYDSEFRLLGSPISTMASLDEAGKVVYMNTFTKSLTPTIRISYMILPWALLTQFREKLGFYACTVSNFEQYTLAQFIQQGYLEKHINRMRNGYRTLRDRLIQCIQQSPLQRYGEIQEEEAGLHFLLKVRTSYRDEELVQRAAKQQLRISCLSQYDARLARKPTRTFLINYSGLEPGKIEETIIRLQKCL